MDQIQAMRTFVRVVESGSFTRAADSLAVPKGTVTKHIQALEALVHAKLLNRTTRRVTVTLDGAAYYERASRLLADLDHLGSSMVNAHATPRGRLRIDVGSATASLVIIPALPAFYALYPDIQIDIGVSDHMVDLMADNVDCMIHVGEIADQSLVARRIAHLPFVTVASPAYLERHGTPLHPLDLGKKGHSMVNQFSGRTRRMDAHEFSKDGKRVDVAAPYKVAVNESNALTTAVLAGLGVSQMVGFIAYPFLESGRLVEVLPDWTREPLSVHAVYPPNRHLSAKVRVFVDWAAQLCGKHPQRRLRSDRRSPS
jgi:DNA-binding transcriptional LysR family regulator